MHYVTCSSGKFDVNRSYISKVMPRTRTAGGCNGESVTHGQGDTRPMVTLSNHRAPLHFGWYQIILLGDKR